MTGYKVVVTDMFGRFRSLTCPPEGTITYEIDKWVFPITGNGPLCIVTAKEDALEAAESRDAIAFSCEYQPCETKHTYVWVKEDYSDLKFKTSLRDIRCAFHWQTTVVAKAVKLLEKIA